MPAKNDNITKDPVAAAKKKTGKKQKRTILKEKMGLTWADAEKLVEQNILEFLSARDKKTKAWATRYLPEAKNASKSVVGYS